jgi:predicted ferric reductase
MLSVRYQISMPHKSTMATENITHRFFGMTDNQCGQHMFLRCGGGRFGHQYHPFPCAEKLRRLSLLFITEQGGQHPDHRFPTIGKTAKNKIAETAVQEFPYSLCGKDAVSIPIPMGYGLSPMFFSGWRTLP